MRARLAARFRDHAKIEVAAPDDLAKRPDASFDLVIMHSVAQYLTPDELDATFVLLRRLLKRRRHVRPRRRAAARRFRRSPTRLALLRFGAAHGFLIAATLGLVRTFFSHYWQLRSALGLTRYGARAMIAKLAAAGLTARRADRTSATIRPA